MVQENGIIEVHINFFIYNSKRCPTNSIVEQGSRTITTLSDLKLHRRFKRSQRSILGPDEYRHYKWYNCMLKSELNFGGENCKLEVFHWDIESGDTELFKLNTEFYTAATIIIGREMEHWYYSNPDINSDVRYGSRLRETSISLFNSMNILERRKKQLRPEPSQGLMTLARTGLQSTLFVKVDIYTGNTLNNDDDQQNKSKLDNEEKYKIFQEIRDRTRQNKIAKLENRILSTIIEETSV